MKILFFFSRFVFFTDPSFSNLVNKKYKKKIRVKKGRSVERFAVEKEKGEKKE